MWNTLPDQRGLPCAGSGTYEVRLLWAMPFLRGTCACMTYVVCPTRALDRYVRSGSYVEHVHA